MKKFAIITLFPEMFEKVLGQSMMWKASVIGAAEFHIINLREFGIGPHKRVDDTVYGGGDGMLLKPEPLFAAIEYAKKVLEPTPQGPLTPPAAAALPFSPCDIDSKTTQDPNCKVVLTSPRGTTWSQSLARKSASDATQNLIIVCGHYEGVDERVLSVVDQQISIGDYVLTGGELPAMVMIDSIVRLLPNVLGGETSAEIESFSDGDNLEYPQYTHPAAFTTPSGEELSVPDILLSGNHAAIAKWRAENAPKR
ncbi:MAG: tRNA (guanosine(37)-N1)-methyltransferase TrmD [Candidatus Nomurabacteria bacterium]|jgi:tRNA (guanine37-N1)-methyltransferase|nr:tRNA (guanosine(37)-N1)-methyltransferase TrmD [Candidatus Nomurabacteria bacterium]